MIQAQSNRPLKLNTAEPPDLDLMSRKASVDQVDPRKSGNLFDIKKSAERPSSGYFGNQDTEQQDKRRRRSSSMFDNTRAHFKDLDIHSEEEKLEDEDTCNI